MSGGNGAHRLAPRRGPLRAGKGSTMIILRSVDLEARCAVHPEAVARTIRVDSHDPRTGCPVHYCWACTVQRLNAGQARWEAAPYARRPRPRHQTRAQKRAEATPKRPRPAGVACASVVRWMGAFAGRHRDATAALEAEYHGLGRDVAAEGQVTPGVQGTGLHASYVGLQADPSSVLCAYAGDSYTEPRGRKLVATRSRKYARYADAIKASAKAGRGYSEVTLRNPRWIAVVVLDTCYPHVREQVAAWAAQYSLPVVTMTRA